MADWREDVERWWASVLGLPVTAFRVGGVSAASRFDHLGVLTVPGAAAPVVYGPAAGQFLQAAQDRQAGRRPRRRR